MKRAYKVNYKFNPVMQCVLGRFDGWKMVLDDSLNYYYYKKPFTYSQSKFNKLVTHIAENRIYSYELHNYITLDIS